MKLLKNNKAATAVEFALTAPVVLLMIFATFEISWLMLSSVILESAVRDAGRAGITGYVPQGMTRDEYIRQQIDNNVILVDKDKIELETKIYDSFSNINQPEPFTDQNGNGVYNLGEPFTDSNGNGQWDSDMGIAGSGGSDAIVVYRVTYPWKMLTPVISNFFPNNGEFDITSNLVVRNEPF